MVDIFAAAPLTIYSRCRFVDKQVDYTSCAYRPAKQGERAKRVEWEHVVTAEAFGRAFVAWRDGDPRCVDRQAKRFRDRHCAAKVDVEYRRIEADMYNLFPEVGELNAQRGNLTMAAVSPGQDVVDTGSGKMAGRSFEPPDAAKGTVARVHLYMDDAYPRMHLLSEQRRKLFEVWDTQYPPDLEECERGRHIAARQGNVNGYIAQRCSPRR